MVLAWYPFRQEAFQAFCRSKVVSLMALRECFLMIELWIRMKVPFDLSVLFWIGRHVRVVALERVRTLEILRSVIFHFLNVTVKINFAYKYERWNLSNAIIYLALYIYKLWKIIFFVFVGTMKISLKFTQIKKNHLFFSLFMTI